MLSSPRALRHFVLSGVVCAVYLLGSLQANDFVLQKFAAAGAFVAAVSGLLTLVARPWSVFLLTAMLLGSVAITVLVLLIGSMDSGLVGSFAAEVFVAVFPVIGLQWWNRAAAAKRVRGEADEHGAA